VRNVRAELGGSGERTNAYQGVFLAALRLLV